jgi:hypothetical protein
MGGDPSYKCQRQGFGDSLFYRDYDRIVRNDASSQVLHNNMDTVSGSRPELSTSSTGTFAAFS